MSGVGSPTSYEWATAGGAVCLASDKTRGIESFVTTYDEGMRDTGPVELLFMYSELMNPCVDIMVKWQHRGVTYRDPEIEHAEPLGSLGLNGADDDPAEFTPTGACLSYRCVDEIRLTGKKII
ncbi:11-beta-hydroxysteroid dehydrogenase 1B-like [Dorcoceras hygrometricum]|uniref:11-beta-hydroxysteroid dehydrogenase 1B-like n=1 Tax=Dorcoceras hygrometricum TaxID=472368 RepID=A0A2Z7B9Z4_9LAMI|nr:11-beta-hydroxysteroid dehydrogenase 1B-like [Dorcoceras hygrometricum]